MLIRTVYGNIQSGYGSKSILKPNVLVSPLQPNSGEAIYLEERILYV